MTDLKELKTYLESLKFDDLMLQEKVKEISSMSKTYLSNGLVVSLTKDYNESQIKTNLKKRQEIESLLQHLPQPYKTIMYMKYLSFLSYTQIADKLELSDKRIYQLHKIGLDLLLEIVNSSDIYIFNKK